MSDAPKKQIILIRHGQTEWSKTGQHTGRSNIDLTERGRREARLVTPTLEGWEFAHVYSSPLSRALETANIAGLSDHIEIDDNLMEWAYGVYEGRRQVDIQVDEPGWSKWTAGVLEGGESAEQVGERADAAIENLLSAADDGPVAVFAHGHFLAILIARWLGMPAVQGKRFIIQTATVSQLGLKRGDHVLKSLNHRCGSALAP